MCFICKCFRSCFCTRNINVKNIQLISEIFLIYRTDSVFRTNSEDLVERRLEEIFGEPAEDPVPNDATNKTELPDSILVEIYEILLHLIKLILPLRNHIV